VVETITYVCNLGDARLVERVITVLNVILLQWGIKVPIC